MTTTQVQYQNLLETVFHNRNTEDQAKQELAETKKHNRKTESQGDYANKSGRMTAEANVKNAKANTKNAETNAKNAKTNAQNAKTNAKNAKTNATNAETKKKEAEARMLKAQADMLKSKAYSNLTVAQIGKEKANTAKLWKDVSNADVSLLVKTGKIGEGIAAAVLCGNILADPKSSKELKDFASGMIAQLRKDSTKSNKVIQDTAKQFNKDVKKKGFMLAFSDRVWKFVPITDGTNKMLK